MGFTAAPEEFDVWVLGDSFMRGLYVIHSNENNLVGMVPHAQSSKSALVFEPE